MCSTSRLQPSSVCCLGLERSIIYLLGNNMTSFLAPLAGCEADGALISEEGSWDRELNLLGGERGWKAKRLNFSPTPTSVGNGAGICHARNTPKSLKRPKKMGLVTGGRAARDRQELRRARVSRPVTRLSFLDRDQRRAIKGKKKERKT